MLKLNSTEIHQWVSDVVGLFAVALLAAALVMSFGSDDEKTRFLVVGAIITNATTVINYLFGSSKGSQRKDDTISAFGSALATSTPGTPLPPMTQVAPPEPITGSQETGAGEEEAGVPATTLAVKP